MDGYIKDTEKGKFDACLIVPALSGRFIPSLALEQTSPASGLY